MTLGEAGASVNNLLPTDGQLPEGWVPCTVRDIAEITYGKGLKEANRVPGPVLVYGSNGIIGSHNVALTRGPVIVLGRKGTVGAVHYSSFGCWPIDTTYFIDRFDGVDARYLAHALRGLSLSELDTSTAVPGLNREDVYRQSIPLPPLAEQRRVVAKVEELLARVNAARERLRRVPAILKRFRQAVLAAACSGRLTAEWREERGLPEWSYTRLSERKASIRIGPFGSVLHRSDYVEGGVPLVNPTHIRDGAIRISGDCAVRIEKAQELAPYRLEVGDIVLGRRGEMGRAAVVRPEAVGYICGTGSMIVRADQHDLRPDFLCLLLRSPQTVAVLEANSVGSTMTNLNQGIVESLEVPHVSREEQDEIVRRVEALFKLADAVEMRVATATLRADKLTQSVLARAFRGELVPTEAELARREGRDYEPASALLERVRRERKVASGDPTKRR